MVAEANDGYYDLHSIVQKWREEGRGYQWIELKLLESGLSKQEVYELYYGVAYDEKASWFYYFVLGLLFSAAVELVVSALQLTILVSFAYSAIVLILTIAVYSSNLFKTSKKLPMLTGMAVVTWFALIIRLSIAYFIK